MIKIQYTEDSGIQIFRTSWENKNWFEKSASLMMSE